MSKPVDVLIVGGGLAGAAAAIVLARAGRAVALIERESAPKHKVCGEFLSAEALELLASLQLPVEALGAVPIHAVRLCSGPHVVPSGLPFAAMSLTRRCLDGALLAGARASGVQVVQGIAVESLGRDNDRWRALLGDGWTVTAPDAVLGTGKHDLRGFARPPGRQSDLVAMKMYFRLAPAQTAALAGHVDLLLYPGGYAGLEPVENGAANLCCLVQRSVLARLGGRWEALLTHLRETCPAARERLLEAQPLLAKPLAVASIPYGFVRSEPAGDRLWAVGDQAAVIPSFTGDGMSIALLSGVRAARSLLAGQTAASFQQTLAHDLRGQVARATAVSRALIFPPTRAVLVTAARLWPGGLCRVAQVTRLSGPAMRAAGAHALRPMDA